MNSRELKEHKSAEKWLTVVPSFSALRRNTLPGQFRSLGRSRTFTSGFIDVSNRHAILLIWRDGEILTDRSFYGYLVEKRIDGKLLTLLEFHWHPSHKGFHCITPCGTEKDYTGRMLSQCRELGLSTNEKLDPKDEIDRNSLIEVFCNICGINVMCTSPLRQNVLEWN